MIFKFVEMSRLPKRVDNQWVRDPMFVTEAVSINDAKQCFKEVNGKTVAEYEIEHNCDIEIIKESKDFGELVR
jgi:hypothetical protein